MKKFILYLSMISLVFGQSMMELNQTHFEYPLNSKFNDYNPIISPSEKYLFFQSDRAGSKGNMDIWVSKNETTDQNIPEWSSPMNLSALNTQGFDGGFQVVFDEKDEPIEIYFTSDASPNTGRNGYDGLNIYHSHYKNGNWTKPEHLDEINSNFDEKMPTISPDGNSIIFSSNRPGGLGKFDMWISYKSNGKWSKPGNLGSVINSSADEILPFYYFDGLALFFSSNRNDVRGNFDLYISEFDGLNFQIPKKMVESINLENFDEEGISLTANANWCYFSSNRKNSGHGFFDIIRSQLPEDYRHPYHFLVQGIVLDNSQNEPIGIESTIKIYTDQNPIRVITSQNKFAEKYNYKDINFKTKLQTGKLYKLEFSSPGYYPVFVDLDLRGSIGQNQSKYIKVILEPISTKMLEDFHVIVRNSKNLDHIQDANVMIFTENYRSGIKLPFSVEKNHYPISLEFIQDFEIFVSKDGFHTKTTFITKSELENSESRTIFVDLIPITDTDLLKTIYFKFNNYKLESDHYKVLDLIVDHLKSHENINIEIEGHTDNIATKQFNKVLSEKRAKVVFDYLQSKGIATKRMTHKGYWYSKPKSDNETEIGRARNRRVEIIGL